MTKISDVDSQVKKNDKDLFPMVASVGQYADLVCQLQ